MVGREGFEPPTLCSQSRCASQTALTPEIAGKESFFIALSVNKIFHPVEHRSSSHFYSKQKVMEDSSIDTGFDAPADLKIPIGIGIAGIIIGGLALIIAYVDRGKIDRVTTKIGAEIEEVRQDVNRAVAGQGVSGESAKEVAALREELESLRAQVAASFESVNSNYATLSETVNSLSNRRNAGAPRGSAAANNRSGGNGATPAAGTSANAASVSGEYTIQAGDNFWKIANKLGCKTADLQELNPDVEPARLRVGQKIKVPAKN